MEETVFDHIDFIYYLNFQNILHVEIVHTLSSESHNEIMSFEKSFWLSKVYNALLY